MRSAFLLSVFILNGVFLTGLPRGAQATEETPSTASPETVRIVTDQDKGTITFIIDGKAAVQIDRDGLRVMNSIEYGGTLTDTGSAHIEKALAGGHDDVR